MTRGTSGGIRATFGQGVFIYVPLVGIVKMPIMHIVDVTVVFDGGMSAARTVGMRMLVVRFMVAHLGCLLAIMEFSVSNILLAVIALDYDSSSVAWERAFRTSSAM